MEERRNAIVEMINQSGTVSFTELKSQFPDVSEMTLRRDLEYLDSNKLIVRIHGGAKSVDVVIGTDDMHTKRSMRNAEAKKQIAQKALQFLKPNTTIFMDSGTTGMELARIFPDGRYMVFTNGLLCAMEIAKRTQTQTYMIGGRVDPYSLCSSGSRTLAALENINLDIAFLGTTGYSSVQGFTIGAEEEYELKREIIRRADKAIVMMDAKKVGFAYTFTIAFPNEIDAVISDGSLDEETLQELQQGGVKIY
ncbi:DeoR/GlpR family DNA-binding transcription regulator [Eubacteriales bacterium OttesenSCG-928-A19]|nr:DeoR/GlpR family DNA-binding transcription regulator [Eubacteriales bacterium OttesenSCG-928-A19]